MEHKRTTELESDRLLLRKFKVDDAESMYRNWASDPEVTKYLTWQAYEDVSVAVETLTEWVKLYENPDYYQWAICLKEIGEPVGSISAVHIKEKEKIIHIGYCIGKEFWHQGITSEALYMIMTYFFNTVGANRIESMHDPNNQYSGTVMEKCGMIYEGTLRSFQISNQGISDAAYYGILKSEWNNLQSQS